MMKSTNSVLRDYVHELEDGSLSDVWSDWKIMFMLMGDISVDELTRKVEQMGIEIIGDVDINFDERGMPDFVTISTDSNIDDKLYAKLYEFSERNEIDIVFFTPSNQVSTKKGIIVNQFYKEYRLYWLEHKIMLKILKDVNPEEWARIQAENVS